jgi:hypothetical protein
MNYGFDKCLHIAQNDLKLINEEAAVSLRMVDGYRDCAMHHHLELSEHALYLNTQAAVTVFNELLMAAFGESLGNFLPERVLPVSTSPPTEMRLFMERELDHLRQLLRPGRRKGAQASAAIRPFLIMESALQGRTEQPPESRVRSTARRIKAGESWKTLFPGVASLRLDTTGQGLTYSVKFVRAPSTTEALPVQVIRENVGQQGALAVREVDMLTRYSMNLSELAQNLGMGRNRTLALVERFGIRNDSEYYKETRFKSQVIKSYSPKALGRLREVLGQVDLEQVWREYCATKRRAKKNT